MKSKRPVIEKRKFTSNAIESKIDEIKKELNNSDLSTIFENCFPNTLDTTVVYNNDPENPDTFVITGDINAMWLRDSTAQVWPYLQFANSDTDLKNLIKGVINRQVKCIQIDPFANAFNAGPSGSEWEADYTEMKPELHERKWEIDSLCYPVRLAYNYWQKTGDTTIFNEDWYNAACLIYNTFIDQQRKTSKGSYKFMRTTHVPSDSLAGYGYGNPVKTTGMICTMFRPSDDAALYAYNIPENMFASVILDYMSQIFITIYKDDVYPQKFDELKNEIDNAIEKFGIREHLNYGKIFAYEVDGYGNALFMDDANVPSLLSIPYLGWCNNNDPVYVATRKFLLSEDNPYYSAGTVAKGICSPHIGQNMIWPISLTIQAMTSNDQDEISDCIRMLLNSAGGTGFMHESFNKDDASDFTRSWFAWANTLFGELIVKVFDKNPGLLKSL